MTDENARKMEIYYVFYIRLGSFHALSLAPS